MYVLGIDVGTGGTRALVIDQGGRIVASATEEHAPFASPKIGWAEQAPEDWWRAAASPLAKLWPPKSYRRDEIACVGFSGQMHGAVMLDDADKVVRPALIWCDVRTEKQCDELTEKIGAERLIQLTCNPALTNFTLTKFLWVRENEPENWKRVRSVMLPKDYVRFRLTGERAIDMADASGTLMLDVANRRWSKEVLQAAEIDEALAAVALRVARCLRQNFRSRARSHRIESRHARRCRRGRSGCGRHRHGHRRLPARSARPSAPPAWSLPPPIGPALDPQGRLHTFCHAIPGRWHVMGVTQSAGLSLRWFRDNFGAQRRRRAIPTNSSQRRSRRPFHRRQKALLWTPYLMGERTPHLDANARAALVGLTASHTRAHMVRAILEGVAFSLKDSFTIFEEMKVPVKKIRLGGGGASSPFGGRFRPTFMGTKSKSSKPKKAQLMARRFLPEWARKCGPRLTPPVKPSCAWRPESHPSQKRWP